MNKFLAFFALTVNSFVCPFLLAADEVNNSSNKVNVTTEPLSEDFLMFLAEMDETDGVLIHPEELFVSNNSSSELAKKRIKNAQQKTDNQLKQVKQLNSDKGNDK